MRYARFGALIALVLLVAACSSESPDAPETPGASPTPGASGSPDPDSSEPAGKPSTDPQIPPPPDGTEFTGAVITRTGGIAGLMQQLVIAPNGSWVYTDERSGAVEQGQLSADERQRMLAVLTNPALAAEAAKGSTGECADAFNYTVAALGLTIEYEQCGDPAQRPLTEQLIRILIDATPL